MEDDDVLVPLKKLGGSLQRKVPYHSVYNWAHRGRIRHSDGAVIKLSTEFVGGVEHSSRRRVRRFWAELTNITAQCRIIGGSLAGHNVTIKYLEDRHYSYVELAMMLSKEDKDNLELEYIRPDEAYAYKSVRGPSGETVHIMASVDLEPHEYLQQILRL